MMKKTWLIIIFILPLVSLAQESKIYQKDGVAIDGYDPVSFFINEKPVKGNTKFSISWEGAQWLFSSKENLEEFKKDEEKYAPQYGGYCAWGMREGYKAPTNPLKAWSIVNDKLYLNYNKNTQKGWLPEAQGNIKRANYNWSKFKHEDL